MKLIVMLQSLTEWHNRVELTRIGNTVDIINNAVKIYSRLYNDRGSVALCFYGCTKAMAVRLRQLLYWRRAVCCWNGWKAATSSWQAIDEWTRSRVAGHCRLQVRFVGEINSKIRGVATGGSVSIYIPPPKWVYLKFFMWLFCLIDQFIPTQIKFLTTPLSKMLTPI